MRSGTEFISNAILAWSKDHKVDWHYIVPGKPIATHSISTR